MKKLKLYNPIIAWPVWGEDEEHARLNFEEDLRLREILDIFVDAGIPVEFKRRRPYESKRTNTSNS